MEILSVSKLPIPSVVILLFVVQALNVLAVGAQLSRGQKDFILQQHNDMRRRVQPSAANMQEMRWDDKLAQVAQRYSQQCAWEHNPSSTSQFHQVGGTRSWQVGENIAYTTSADADLAINWALTRFFNERDDYRFNTNQCSPDKICGHYTQMVWDDSMAIGCGITRCASLRGAQSTRPAWFLTCNYGPSGNYNGRQPYKAGRQCSQCPTSAPHCNNGLCSSVASGQSELLLNDPEPARQRSPSVRQLQNQLSGGNTQHLVGAQAQLAETARSPQIQVRSQNSPPISAIAQLESRRLIAKFSHSSQMPTLSWNPRQARTSLIGGFKYDNGALVVPHTGQFFVATQLWQARNGGSSVHYLYADTNWLASSVEDTASGQRSSATTGIYFLQAGQRLTARLASTAGHRQRGSDFVYRSIRESSFNAYSL